MAITPAHVSTFSYNVFEPISRYVASDIPAAIALSLIEGDLVTAANALAERRYQDAIDAYLAAERLMYRQLNPRVPPFDGPIVIDGMRDPRLFEALLDASAQYLNLLPVNEPALPVQPRQRANAALLRGSESLAQVGLTSTALTERSATNAAGDWRAGQDLLAVGNEAAARFFLDRAKRADGRLVRVLDGGLPGREDSPEGSPRISDTGGGTRATGLTGVRRTDVSRSTGESLLGRTTLGGSVARTFASDLSITEAAFIRPELPRSPELANDRSVGTMLAGQLDRFDWAPGGAPDTGQIRTTLYDQRIAATDVDRIVMRPIVPSDIPLWLPHAYYFVVPLGLAEAYHGLGQFETAEGYYLQAAGYQFLNAALEAPYVWRCLATLYLDWGNSFFRLDDGQAALPIYSRVIMPDDSEPASPLYATAGLTPAADMARTVLANLATVETLAVDPAIASVIVEVRQQILKVNGGLDFWGFSATSIPIWTFDYLQSVATNFAQLAIGAERDVINFWDRAGQGNLSRLQLQQNVAQSQAEVTAANLQAAATRAEERAYRAGATLAQAREDNANTAVVDYTAMSRLAISYQASSAQVSGGDDGDPNRLNELADTLLGGTAIRGSRATIAAATQLAAAKANREYEIGALERQAEEMALARAQADREVAAAAARVAVADAAVTIARLRATSAAQLLDAFADQFFTPEVWQRMGDTMYRLYRRYLDMGIRAARLMQQAYNFETDQDLRLIRGDYSTDEVKGLLGADALMADVQTFTYDLITSQAGKPQPIRQTISLASRYPFQFETQFRTSGVLEFETRMDDVDLIHPGTYAQRIEAVEVEFDGIVPATGVTGTLSNAGVSMYRIPASAWTDRATSGLKYRVQPEETLLLSDYAIRQDGLLAAPSSRMLRVFQGAGVASAWRLEVPRATNDLDFGAVTDVRVTFYYQARFDPDLRPAVKAQLAARPGVHAKDLALPLRWLYPDAFFRFVETGELRISLERADFPANELDPTLAAVGILVATSGGLAPDGIDVSVKTPANAAVSTSLDAAGTASSDGGGALAPLASGTAIGEYLVNVTDAANPGLDRGQLANVVLILGYTYTPRA